MLLKCVQLHTQLTTLVKTIHFVKSVVHKMWPHLLFVLAIAWLGSLANAGGSWLSYSGVVRILFPEQLRAVAERLCRCHVIHSISVLKVSMCAAGICPGVHRGFSDSSTLCGWKEIGPLCGDLLPKRKIFLLWNERFGGWHIEAYEALLPPAGPEWDNTDFGLPYW